MLWFESGTRETMLELKRQIRETVSVHVSVTRYYTHTYIHTLVRINSVWSLHINLNPSVRSESLSSNTETANLHQFYADISCLKLFIHKQYIILELSLILYILHDHHRTTSFCLVYDGKFWCVHGDGRKKEQPYGNLK